MGGGGTRLRSGGIPGVGRKYSPSTSTELKALEDAEKEKETKDNKLKNGGSFKTEKDKFWVGKSTDKIERNLIYKNIKFLQNINNKMKKEYNLTTNLLFEKNIEKDYNKDKLTFHLFNLGVGTNAIYSDNKIIINKKRKENFHVKLHDYNSLRNFKAPHDKKNQHVTTLTHEFGHFIFDKIAKLKYKESKDPAVSIAFDILNIQKKEFGIKIDDKTAYISDYGEKNPHEWLAEVFVNLHCSNKKNKTTLAKSMELYLKRLKI